MPPFCKELPDAHVSLFFWLFSKFRGWALIPVPGKDIWVGSPSLHSAIFRKDSVCTGRTQDSNTFLPFLQACQAPLPGSPAAASCLAFPKVGNIRPPFFTRVPEFFSLRLRKYRAWAQSRKDTKVGSCSLVCMGWGVGVGGYKKQRAPNGKNSPCYISQLRSGNHPQNLWL